MTPHPEASEGLPALLAEASECNAGSVGTREEGATSVVRSPQIEGFIGRERELDELLQAFEQVRSGRGRLYMLSGEPGIGKTRLGEAVSIALRDRGAVIASGRCWDAGGAPAFWPWIQVIRSLLEGYAADVPIPVDDRAAYVAHLVPEIRDYVPQLPDPPPAEGEIARVPLFDGVAHLFSVVAKEAPLVIFIDDLHAADTASLLLTKYVARELVYSPVLGLATYRPTEARLNPEVGSVTTLTEARRISLGGLDQAEVHQLIEHTMRRAPSESLVSAVHNAAEGNPFFVTEIVRTLASDPGQDQHAVVNADSLPIPDEVRETIRRRIEPLDDQVRRTLSVASVIGRQFSAGLLERVLGLGPGSLSDILQRAVNVAVLIEDRRSVSTYDFAHALFRETLYQDLLTPERIKLHRQVGEALESLSGRDLPTHVAGLAYHFLEAAPSGTLEKAIEYGTRAGEQAETIFAYEEATIHYERTLRALEVDDSADEVLRCGLLLSLGRAQSRAGDSEGAKRSFKRAAGIARRLKSSTYLANAALGYAGTGFLVRSGAGEVDVIELLEEALRMLPPKDSSVGVMIRGRLAMELYWSDKARERGTLANEAVEIARRLNDDRTLAFALSAARFALWRPDKLDESITIASEVIHLAEQLQDKELQIQGYGWRLRDLLELADITAVHRDIEMVCALAKELLQPIYIWYCKVYRCLQAQWAGEFEQAEKVSNEAHRIGTRVHEGLASQVTIGNLIAIRRDQGRLAEMRSSIEGLRQLYPQVSLWPITLAAIAVEEGDIEGARLEFERLKKGGFTLPKDLFWTANFVFLAELSAVFEDRGAAQVLYEMLLPFARRNVIAGRTGAFSVGSTSHYLGILGTTAGLIDEAEKHFTDALEIHSRMGAKVYLARTQLEYAEMLIGRGNDGDMNLALDLLRRAAVTAERVRSRPIAERSTALLRSVGRPRKSAAPATSASFIRGGDYWEVTFAERTARLKDVKGNRYLATLLAHPGREFLALELAGGTLGLSRERQGDVGLTGKTPDGEEILDEAAKNAYRRRLRDLQDDLEEARNFVDHERVARAQEELEFLGRELSAAVGLGGRDRKAASATERARMAVTRAIRGAIDRIDREMPRLGGHLAASIKTGTYCSYSPDPNAEIDWQICS